MRIVVQIKKVGVIGAGTMGQGIAEILAGKGLEVFLVEKTPEKLDEAWDAIAVSLDKKIQKWAITASEKKIILSKIQKVYELDKVADCDLVIETITEDLQAKKEVLKNLDRICPPQVILASNTSVLSLTELAGETNRPDRVIGAHFHYPVDKIDLVEVIKGLKTSEVTYEITKLFIEETLQKKSINTQESPGFVTTRLICTLINEALHVLSEGIATAEDIDSAMRIGYAFNYGPLEMADRLGIDAVLSALEGMFREFGDIKYRPNFILKQKVRAGHLGTKSGQGFFRYDKEGDRI